MVQATERLTAELRFDERIEIGKADEKRQVETLCANGFDVHDVATKQDMIDKIDRRIVYPDGTVRTLQIKGRDENPAMQKVYNDILIDYYEPYCGLGHQYTKNGRDQVSKYECFTCRVKTTLYLIDGAAQKRVIADVMAEWESSQARQFIDKYIGPWADGIRWSHRRGEPDWQRTEMFKRFPTLYSETYEGIQVKCTQDRKNFRPKLLIFIPPTIYSEADARKFEMHG